MWSAALARNLCLLHSLDPRMFLLMSRLSGVLGAGLLRGVPEMPSQRQRVWYLTSEVATVDEAKQTTFGDLCLRG